VSEERDDYLDQLRHEARTLRYEPESDVVWDRLAARIQDRIQAPAPSVLSILAGWFRFSIVPIALALITVAWMTTSGFDPLSVDPIGAIAESSLVKDAYFVYE